MHPEDNMFCARCGKKVGGDGYGYDRFGFSYENRKYVCGKCVHLDPGFMRQMKREFQIPEK